MQCRSIQCSAGRYLLSLLPGHSATALISATEPRKIEETQEQKLYTQVEDEKKLNPPGPKLSFATLVKSMTQIKSNRARKNSTLVKCPQSPVLEQDERQSEVQSDHWDDDFLNIEEKSEQEI